MRNSHLVLLASAMSALIACSGENTNDASNNNDASGDTHADVANDTQSMMDGSVPDSTPGDSNVGTDAANDTPAVVGNCTSTALSGTCTASTDLNTMGTALATGTGREITGNNCGAPATLPSEITAGTCAQDAKGGSLAGYVSVFDYTMQGDGILTVSTANSGTDAPLDTIVWMADSCAGTNEFGCNDDVDYEGGIYQSTAASDGTIAAGTHVKIFVGAFSPPVDADHADRGTFHLTVTETAATALGAACTANTCVSGAHCIPDAGSTTMGHCLADGTTGAACRAADPMCDTGLTCNATSMLCEASTTL